MRRFFSNYLLIDATDRSKISSDQKRLFFAESPYPLTFFSIIPFKDEEARKNKGARGFAAKTRNNSILNNSTPRNHIYILSVYLFSANFFEKL